MHIKLIKPFYGHNDYRRPNNPIPAGKVLNYQANPERAKELIKRGIAEEYVHKK